MPGTATLRILDDREDVSLDTCATCPSLCRWSCPVAEAEARETTSPHRLSVMAGLLKRQRLTAEQVDGTPYHCSMCSACTHACLHDNDVGLLMALARARVLGEGAAPETVRHVTGQFAVAGNAAGRSLSDALQDAVVGAGHAVVADATEVYWPGCEVLAKSPSAAGDAVRAMELSGAALPAVVSISDSCCGLPLLWAGELDGFRAHATRFAAQFAQVKTVVAHDPTCAHAVSVRYAQLGVAFRPRVVTLAEHLAEAWPAAKTKQAAPAYIDGCAQARGMKAADAPRQAIESATGSAPIELLGATGLLADCCGGQGLMPDLVPSTATAMASARIDAFRQSGAERLVTASPRCHHHLLSVDPSLPVDDMAVWLAGR